MILCHGLINYCTTVMVTFLSVNDLALCTIVGFSWVFFGPLDFFIGYHIYATHVVNTTLI